MLAYYLVHQDSVALLEVSSRNGSTRTAELVCEHCRIFYERGKISALGGSFKVTALSAGFDIASIMLSSSPLGDTLNILPLIFPDEKI